jgi:hypothetical protein
MTTCPQCAGTGKLKRDAYSLALMVFQPVLAAATLVWARKRPQNVAGICPQCAGSGHLDDTRLSAYLAGRRRERLMFAALVFGLLCLLVLAALWVRHEFAVYS